MTFVTNNAKLPILCTSLQAGFTVHCTCTYVQYSWTLKSKHRYSKITGKLEVFLKSVVTFFIILQFIKDYFSFYVGIIKN